MRAARSAFYALGRRFEPCRGAPSVPPDDFKGLDGLITIVPVTPPEIPRDR